MLNFHFKLLICKNKLKYKWNVVDFNNKGNLQIKNLQESYQMKCKEYEQLLIAYKNLALKFSNAAEATKLFIKSLSTSMQKFNSFYVLILSGTFR